LRDMTFDDANARLQLKDDKGQPIVLNEDNFAQNKQQVADALRKTDPRAALAYESIDRLNQMGIQVINAETEHKPEDEPGTHGPGWFDSKFITSNHDMRSIGEDGTILGFSGGFKDKGNTGLGAYEVQYLRDADGGKGRYQVVGNGKVYESYGADEFERKGAPEPYQDWTYKWSPGSSTPTKELTEAGAAAADAFYGDSHTPANRRFADLPAVQTFASLSGNSFANLDKIKELSMQ